MATVDTSVNELVINKLTQAQYDALTEKSPTELYFVTDAQDDSLPIQVEVMPEASTDYAGRVIQYIGETNTEYTHGFFYEFGEKFIMPTVREFDAYVSTPNGDASAVVDDQEKFFEFVIQTVVDNGYSGLVAAPTHVNIMLDPEYADGDKYPVTIIAGEGEIEMQAFFTLEYLQQNTGISGLNDSGEFMVVEIMCNLTTPGSLTEGWKQVDVQPFTAGIGIDTTNNKINVQNPVYKTVNPYFDSDGVDLIGLRIGRGPFRHEHFDRGAIILGGTEMQPSREIGGSVVIGGKAAVEFGGSVAIGSHARAIGDVSTAIGGGRNCAATGDGAIQLGYNGVNPDNNTFKVATLSGNFEMMSANGTIPTDRYTTTPTDAGTYVPKLTIAEDGTATREWGTESGGVGGDYLLKTDAAATYLPLNGGSIKYLTITNNANYIGFKLSGSYTLSLRPANPSYNTTLSGLGLSETILAFGWDNWSANYKLLLDTGTQKLFPYTDNSFSLGLSERRWNNVYTYKLNNGADITVPETGGTMVVATPPTDNGTYVLKATVVDGVVTTEWVSEA